MPKSLLITGCSSGIGWYAAHAMQKRGYRVFATARKSEDVKKLQAQGLESVLLDINDSDSMRTALSNILEKTNGSLDALFNNCGYVQAGAIEDLTRDALRAQFETNVFGQIELTNQVLTIMRKQGHGRIIQNGSILGTITMPYRGAYAASKFAIEGLFNTLRQELRGTHIFVSIIEPGPIATDLRDNAHKKFKEMVNLQNSHHQEIYAKMQRYFEPGEKRKFTQGPEAIIPKLIHALEKPRPKARYFVGLPAHGFALLRRVLSDQTLDWIITKVAQKETQ